MISLLKQELILPKPKTETEMQSNEEPFAEKGPYKFEVVMMPKYDEDNYMAIFCPWL